MSSRRDPDESMPIPEGVAALLGDAHLNENDPEVDAFVDFLEDLPREITTLVILGDLFTAWVGRKELIRPHHERVVTALRRLRGRGCRLLYVEGNHDYFLSPLYEGDPFDRLSSHPIDEPLAGLSVHLAHGDLINTKDHQYRVWHAVSKHRLFFGLFNLISARRRLRVVDWLETAMEKTNSGFRKGFPLDECESYARPRIRGGRDLLVFGHFHEERRIDYQSGKRRGSVYVLPAWRDRHRYLRLEPGREPRFVSA